MTTPDEARREPRSRLAAVARREDPAEPRRQACTAVAAILASSNSKARLIRLVCLVAAPKGVDKVLKIFPAMTIVVAALDRYLDSHGYIRPGLGDAGDRRFGTK